MAKSKIKFLTSGRKQKELKNLKALIKKGEIDKLMIPWLKEINSIPGVVSQYCCAGHSGKHNGNLVLLVSEKIALGLFSDFSSSMLLTFNTFDDETRVSIEFHPKNREWMLGHLLRLLKFVSKNNRLAYSVSSTESEA